MNLDAAVLTADYRARRPSVELEHHADAIIALGAEYGITNIRVFGSCVTGADGTDSNINLIGVAELGIDFFDLDNLVGEVEKLTGYPVEFIIDDEERPAFIAHEELVSL